ncbi:hypothetical protein [Sporomusa sphaeroides]|uniref:FlgN protein n=1 Tax=Sporomusa sphaeroides DSM 2875 TaxID=1337886 RepID=A0ABM9VZC5_9FIRM|nr:hypothetical protein [Sporomusa sphaeroides]OLS57054.1 hypothetical protein SPSPH_05560 [Sporomusa sphaeroides DSM 2875]CVK18240.1 hypothetical protein SSPH_00877 [Sporomusa sphaeroides DSM 2875]
MKSLDAERHLARKLELLGQMTANTEKLQRFIPKRNMLGLKRVLQEMGRLIEELSAINILLASQVNGWQQPAGFQAVAKDLALQQTALVTAYRQTLQAAAAEQQQIAGELRELRAAQRLQTGYTGSWAPHPGGRLSVKG